MPNWLAKASRVFQRRAPLEPESYEIRCPCGGGFRGLRDIRPQRVDCPECGDLFFILPIDIYPKPKPRSNGRTRRQPATNTAEASAAATRDTTTAEAVDAPPLKERVKQRLRTTGRKTRRGIQLAVQRQRSLFTPFRLVLLGAAVVLAVTSYQMLQRRAKDEATRQIRPATENGYAALQEGDFLTASSEFEKAVEALETLGRDDVSARTVRQMLRESTAATHLTSASLWEIATEAVEMAPQEGLRKWSERFNTHYRDLWVIMETTVSHDIAPDGTAAFSIDYPLVIGGSRVQFEMDASFMDHYVGSSDPRPIVFAAQLAECRPPVTPQGTCVIKLRDDSAFLWTDFDNYRSIGFEIDEISTEEDLRKLLSQQARIVGIE